MKWKKVFKDVLFDWKHYLGWILTIVAVVGVSHLLGIHDWHVRPLTIIFLFATVMVVDVFKHKWGLQ